MKVFASLDQAQEDEALACFDRQYDQIAFTSKTLLGLPEGAQTQKEKDRLFFFVFGYAQAKGWTDVDKRIGSNTP